jgi:cell division protein ZapD
VTESAYTCFEQPLNERTRTFLRLEHLFTQLQHHERDDSNWGRRAALTALLDILTVLSRHDLRNEVGKELAEQHATLSRLKNRPDVDHERLEGILSELVMLGRGLQAIPPKFASYMLRDNDLLTSISNRSAIPGGACGFDLPGYQSWLSLPSQEQARYQAQDYTAEGGVLVHNTSNDTQLIRVLVPADERVYPEISAGRHRSTVRFMEQYGGELHSRQTDRDIPFRMACCRL